LAIVSFYYHTIVLLITSLRIWIDSSSSLSISIFFTLQKLWIT